MKYFVAIAIFFLGTTKSFAEGESKENLLSISQGISSPSITSTVNYSNGFTKENPVGVAYQDSARLSLQYDSGDNDVGETNDGYGGEFGMGNGILGLAVGYYTRNCDGCDGDTAGSLGVILGGLGLGVRVMEERYTAGLLVGANGKHRFGLVGDLRDPDGDDNNITSYGAGYSYVENKYTLTVDASKLDYEDKAIEDDLILLTPGIAIRFGMVALSASYDMRINEDDDANDSDDNDLWWGVGIGEGKTWHLAIYGDYVNEWSLSGSLFF